LGKSSKTCKASPKMLVDFFGFLLIRPPNRRRYGQSPDLWIGFEEKGVKLARSKALPRILS
jgi:hypothetical protein